MIINEKEKTELSNLLRKVQDFLESSELENTNVGIDIYEKCQDWLVKLGE